MDAGAESRLRLSILALALGVIAVMVFPWSSPGAELAPSATRVALEIFVLCAVLLGESQESTRVGSPALALFPLPLWWASPLRISVPHPGLAGAVALVLFAGLATGVLAGIETRTRLWFAVANVYLLFFYGMTRFPGRGAGVALLLFVAAALYLRSVVHVTSGGRMLAAALGGWGLLLLVLAAFVPQAHLRGWLPGACFCVGCVSVVFSAVEESLRGWIVFARGPQVAVHSHLEALETSASTPVVVRAGVRWDQDISRW